MSLLAIDGQRLSQVDLKNSQFRFFVYLLEQCERDIKYAGGISEADLAEFYSVADRKMEIRKEGKKIEGKPVTLLSVTLNENAVSKQGLMLSFSKDYVLFKKLVKTGQLYEHIRELIWKETGRSITRNEAKKVMFTIAFASHRYQPEEKQIMRKYFPSIISIIDNYKKQASKILDDSKKGSASFAILLQQTESLIFIDEILAKCHKAGIKALSKHDSIVCRQCDKHKVTKVICKVLNSLFGHYTYALDIDGDLFDLKPKRKSRLGRVAMDLFNSVMGYSYQANAPPLFKKSLSFSLDEKETKNQANLNSSVEHQNWRASHPSNRAVTPGMKRGDLYEMRKAFYNDTAKAQDNTPVGERSRGMTLEEMRRELLGK